MSIELLNNLIVIILALLASAFFSGMEIAFLSSNKLKLELDKKQSTLFSNMAGLFSRHPAEYMTTILIGNNIALVVYSLTMSVVISRWLVNSNETFSLVIETLVSTIIIIFLAEFIPKSIVKNNPNFYYRNFTLPVFIFYLIFFPISKVITLFSKGIMRVMGVKNIKKSSIYVFNKEDLANLVEDISNVSEMQVENDKEMKIFQNALDFSDLRLRDCMIRRIEIEALDIESTLDEAKALFIETKFSRLPVYKESIDNIIGYINNKDFFKSPSSLKEILLEPLYTPETMSAQKLLTIFIKSKSSLAIVLDEFGGTAGMVTIEDILEEIFGEIEDEHDSITLIDKQLSDGSYLMSGRVEVEDINDKYQLGIPENEDYQTLAGYIIFNNEGLPKQGDKLDIASYSFHIIKMSSTKIELVKITKIK